MYTVFETGGKQYHAREGDILFVEKLDVQPDETISFDKVLVIGDDDNVRIGTPTIEGATVTAQVLKNGKAKKITVFTYRAKKGSKRKMGHRQPYTKIQISTISA